MIFSRTAIRNSTRISKLRDRDFTRTMMERAGDPKAARLCALRLSAVVGLPTGEGATATQENHDGARGD
jgi:hypothetical protein